MPFPRTRRLVGALFGAACVVALAGAVSLRMGLWTDLIAAPARTADSDLKFPAPEPILELPKSEEIAIAKGWPQLFGPTHDSISHEQNVNIEWSEAGPPVLWKQPVGSGYSAPVVVDSRVVVLHRLNDEEIVECFSAESGDSIWQFKYPTSYKCKYEHSSGPYSTPIIDGERVYTLGAQGQLHCLSAEEGKPVWSRSLSGEFQAPEGIYAVGHSPLLEDDRLIVNVGGTAGKSGIVAFDKSTGKTLWQATEHGASYSTPRAATIHGRRMVFVLTSVGLVALDPKDGRVHWTIDFHPMLPDAVSATSPLVYGDIVLVSAYQAGSLCLRVFPDGTYKELWRNRRNFVSQFNPITCIDGYVYGWHFFDLSFRCFELTTGKPKWTHKSQVSRGSHVVVGDRIILFGEYGELSCLDVSPDRTNERAITGTGLLSFPCFSAPALADGRLYLRNEQQILCLDLRRSATIVATLQSPRPAQK